MDKTEHDPAATVAAIEAQARRIDTPCGEGTMAWRVWGTGRPLLLAHGAAGSWTHWIRNIEPLVAAGRMVIAADLPGSGASADPATPDHPGISAALAAGLPIVLGDARPIDMAGFSFGGVCLAWLAGFHPEWVRHLVLIGCGGLDTPMGHVARTQVSGLRGEEREEALRFNLNGMMLHARESADALARHLLIANVRKGSAVLPQHLVLPDMLVRALPAVTAQVDAIWGEHDAPHPDPALQLAAIHRTHPAARLRVMPGAGHWAMYEAPGECTAALLELLGEQPAD